MLIDSSCKKQRKREAIRMSEVCKLAHRHKGESNRFELKVAKERERENFKIFENRQQNPFKRLMNSLYRSLSFAKISHHKSGATVQIVEQMSESSLVSRCVCACCQGHEGL